MRSRRIDITEQGRRAVAEEMRIDGHAQALPRVPRHEAPQADCRQGTARQAEPQASCGAAPALREEDRAMHRKIGRGSKRAISR